MVKYYTHSLDVTFMALADATRRAILTCLAENDCTVSEIAEPFNVSLPAISKHLKVLENAGFIIREKEGRTHRCRLNADPMKGASEWIAKYEKFWRSQFDALDQYLEKTKSGQEKRR